jgi:hypothetical protein
MRRRQIDRISENRWIPTDYMRFGHNFMTFVDAPSESCRKTGKDGSQKGRICVIFLPICDYAQKVK